MIRYHNLNGQIVKIAQAQIGVNDVGLLRGYGIFDFFPIIYGRPLFERDYFDRFYLSANLMNLEVPVNRAELHDRVVDLASRNEISRGYTKLVLTGGYADDGYTPGKNNLFILQHGDVKNDPESYSTGITLVLQKYLKDQPRIKTLHYANALKNRQMLTEANAMDLLYHDGRHIRETSRANFFIVDKTGKIHTTKADVLSGITRKHVIKVARTKDLEVVEGAMPISMLLEAEECFITSTTKGVLPVRKISDYIIGQGVAGPLSRELQTYYRQYCEQVAQGND
jgi:branched-subunit amino acid aminotransferase/4-amino-4-deoxychorismate lyase